MKYYKLMQYPQVSVDMDDGRIYQINMGLLTETYVSISFQAGFIAGLIKHPKTVDTNLPDVKKGYILGKKIRLKQPAKLPIWLSLTKEE